VYILLIRQKETEIWGKLAVLIVREHLYETSNCATLVGAVWNARDTPTMGQNEDGLGPLLRKLSPAVDKDRASELLRVLDYMPRAIIQVAAHVQQRAPQMAVFNIYMKSVEVTITERTCSRRMWETVVRTQGYPENRAATKRRSAFDTTIVHLRHDCLPR
jgi:hypothetical protein